MTQPQSRSLAFAIACLSSAAYLPLRNKEPFLFQLMLLPLTALFLSSIYILLERSPAPWQKLAARLSLPRLMGLLGICLQALALGMHQVQSSKYAGVGYAPNWPLAFLGYGLSIALFAWLGLRESLKPKSWLFLILASYSFSMGFSILYYPLNPNRSDMLPILEEAGKAFLGDPYNPAAVYQAKPFLASTYMPGLWLSYLPATFARLDLRLFSLASVLACAGFLFQAAPQERRLEASAFLIPFLLSPWFQFRHESYLLGLLGFAGAYLYFSARGREGWASVLLAWLCSMSQLAWFVVPFHVWRLFRQKGLLPALGAALGCLLVLALIVLPFALAPGSRFLEIVFGTWARGLYADGPNFSYWIALYLPRPYLQKLQALLLLALFLYSARRLDGAASLFKWSGLALCLFIMTNSPVRDYFFFLPCLFFAFAALAPGAKGSRA